VSNSLPGWDEMSDLDKGAALLHIWKRDWEGPGYAVANYPARYFEHPALTGLDPRTACVHAVQVCGSFDAVEERIGPAELDHLYNLALEEHRRRCPECYQPLVDRRCAGCGWGRPPRSERTECPDHKGA